MWKRALSEHRPKAPPAAVKRAWRPTEGEIDRLVARYAELQSLRLLAAEQGMDRGTLRAALKRRGVRLAEKPGLSEAEIARAVELYATGHSSTVIGRQLGFDNHTVLKGLRAAGVTIRPPLGSSRLPHC